MKQTIEPALLSEVAHVMWLLERGGKLSDADAKRAAWQAENKGARRYARDIMTRLEQRGIALSYGDRTKSRFQPKA